MIIYLSLLKLNILLLVLHVGISTLYVFDASASSGLNLIRDWVQKRHLCQKHTMYWFLHEQLWDEITLELCKAALVNGYSAEMWGAEVDAMVFPTLSPMTASGIGDLSSNKIEVIGTPAAADSAADTVVFVLEIAVYSNNIGRICLWISEMCLVSWGTTRPHGMAGSHPNVPVLLGWDYTQAAWGGACHRLHCGNMGCRGGCWWPRCYLFWLQSEWKSMIFLAGGIPCIFFLVILRMKLREH